MDYVLNTLQARVWGGHIDSKFAKTLTYADNLVLLSPSLICIQSMLDICAEKFEKMGLNFML